MTDEEMVKAMEICKDKEIPCDDCPLVKCGDCGEILRQYFYDRFKQLQSENAALRKQISEMVMPPCTLGDTLYIVACTFGDGYVEDEIVHQSGFSVVKSVVTEKNFYKMCDLVRNGKAFFSREAAERELEELVCKCRCKFDRELEDKE